MCKCTPTKRTPYCGAPGCEQPPQPSVVSMYNVDVVKDFLRDYLETLEKHPERFVEFSFSMDPLAYREDHGQRTKSLTVKIEVPR